ncbi:MAG: hypothetical protein J6I76_07910 [Oribacterium sp.]|nr:hypothetical protein [Oribacterium sp.]
MSRDKRLKIADIFVFFLIFVIAITTLFNDNFSGVIDAFFLPEKKNEVYYDILNKPSKLYESKELSEKGTKNLLANYLSSGDRDSGYSINVNADGTFLFSGKYNGENDNYESITPTGVGFDLPSGDYVLSDGGASSEESMYLKLTGVKRMIGGGIEYVDIATLPGNASFHWDRDSCLELYCEMVIHPGASADSLKFSPMLLKSEDALDQEYQPCMVADFDWDGNKPEEVAELDKYDIYKGVLDSELVPSNDWELFSKHLRYQMHADRAVIDLKDGSGIEILKKDYPMATYGKLNASLTVSEGKTINISDYVEVLRAINTESESHDSIGNEKGEDLSSEGSDLKNIRDFYTYLKALDNSNYVILISINGEGVSALNRENMELLYRLGIETNLADHDNYIEGRKYLLNSFGSVLRNGKAEAEKVGEEKVVLYGTFSDGQEYIVESAGQKSGDSCASIKIGGNEYAMNFRGMNFVVYDEEQHLVVDTVCFDTNSELKCYRQAG